MNISPILNKIAIKIPYLEKIIYQITFEHIDSDNQVAFLLGKTIFYTDKLFSDFSDDEQIFITAHEIMHYFFHQKNGSKDLLNFDEDLANFVEDAQINQILIKLNFMVPKGVVLLEDALNYGFEELYNKLLPIRKELLKDSNWSKYTNVTDILNNTEFTTNNNQRFKK